MTVYGRQRQCRGALTRSEGGRGRLNGLRDGQDSRRGSSTVPATDTNDAVLVLPCVPLRAVRLSACCCLRACTRHSNSLRDSPGPPAWTGSRLFRCPNRRMRGRKCPDGQGGGEMRPGSSCRVRRRKEGEEQLLSERGPESCKRMRGRAANALLSSSLH